MSQLSHRELAALADDYRDTLLSDLGVLATTDQQRLPRGLLRDVSLKRGAAHSGLGSAEHRRPLHDLREGTQEFLGVTARFATVRPEQPFPSETAGTADALVWNRLPTPREIRLAEHLVDDRARPHPDDEHAWDAIHDPVRVGEAIVTLLFGMSASTDDSLWLPVSQTDFLSASDASGSVSALSSTTPAGRLDPIQVYRGPGQGEFRWSVSIGPATIAVESATTPPPEPSDARIHVGYNGNWTATASTAPTVGSITLDVAVLPPALRAELSGVDSIDTDLWTIPECKRPEEVLGLPYRPVNSPAAEGE